MTTSKTIGKRIGAALGVAAGFGSIGVLAAIRGGLPRVSGTLRVAGLRAQVEVIRDRWGVPHIYADNTADLFMAQGYLHAQDRLWQMDFQRRLGHGQLAEVFGAVALPADRYMRVLGLGRVAQRELALIDDDARAAITAYVAGVNAFVDTHRFRLPVEFILLRERPRPWELADVQVLSKVLALSLSENWALEVLRARIVAAVGPARAAQLEPHYPGAHPLIIPTGTSYSNSLGATTLDFAAAAAPFIGSTDAGQGSNAWAVNGMHTLSGKPLLANDPHLGLQIPSLWYENHLRGGDMHVTGVSLPGAPGVVIGHNQHIAWGVTNVMADVQDVYIERFDVADPRRYQFQEGWEQAETVRESIVVRGQAHPFVEEVRITRHGPVISPLVPQESGIKKQASNESTQDRLASHEDTEELALHWTALQPARTTSAVLQINRAHNWSSFCDALADWHCPPQNFVYADVEGHVGYALGGALPLRDNHDGRVPVPGWDGAYEWRGTIPAAQTPRVLDPATGTVVTANNRVASDEYPYPLQAEYLSGYRATRIGELLAQTQRHDHETFARIQNDQRSLAGLALAALAGRLAATDATERNARAALVAWDGALKADSVAGTMYARLRGHLLRLAYADIAEPLGTQVGLGALAWLPAHGYLTRAFPALLDAVAARDDATMPTGWTADTVLAEAWAATIRELRAEYGDDVQTWQYGRAHQLSLRHAFGAVPALAKLFNRGPFPTGGDSDTVNMGNLPRTFAGAPFYVGPSYRQICDTGDWDRSLSIHTTGQSGQPGSAHYADFIEPWLQGRYHAMPWSRTLVEEFAENRLVLRP